MNNRKFGLNADWLRWFALGCMLLDHLWGTFVPGNIWMNCVGRLAYPIFAFQLVEGYFHTHDYRAYRNRLLILAAFSEIPFDLMMFSTCFFPFHQNVIFTLVIGLVMVHTAESIREGAGKHSAAVWKLIGLTVLSIVLMPDYSIQGVLMILAFYLCRFVPAKPLFQLFVMIAINWFGFQGQEIPITAMGMELFLPVQAFAILALIPIWLYNGKKGRAHRFVQWLSYGFYPLHMLVLHLIQRFCF